MTGMGRCKDCMYWRFIRSDSYESADMKYDRPHGECRLIDDLSWDPEVGHVGVHAFVSATACCDDPRHGHLAINIRKGLIDGGLLTGEDFGCVHFTKRETT